MIKPNLLVNNNIRLFFMKLCRFAINFLSISIEFDFFHGCKFGVRVKNCSISNERLWNGVVGLLRTPLVVLIEMNKTIRKTNICRLLSVI